MIVRLQVVGIFYDAEIAVPEIADPTVLTVMEAARGDPKGVGASPRNPAQKFDFTTNVAGAKESASSFLASYAQPVKTRVLAAGTTYPPGEYFLAEHLSDRPAYTVWQYYLFDAAGRYLNEFGKATPFTRQGLLGVPVAGSPDEKADVARVTWRLVTVLAQPTTALIPENAQLVAAGSPPSLRGA